MIEDFSDDIELVDRLKKGDLVAFDILFHKYSKRLYSFAFKYLRSKEESYELVQTVFLKLWENHRSLKRESSLKSFLFTIAYNEICSLFRRRICLQKYIDKTRFQKVDISTETEDDIDCKSLMERVNQIIAQLPDKQRSIFIKSRIEGQSSKAIASELGLSSKTIDNYISKILRVINENLAKEI